MGCLEGGEKMICAKPSGRKEHPDHLLLQMPMPEVPTKSRISIVDISDDDPNSPVMVANDPEKRVTVLFVLADKWSDGTAAASNMPGTAACGLQTRRLVNRRQTGKRSLMEHRQPTHRWVN